MTTSLELSKALFEKGLKIETEKWWADVSTDRRWGKDNFKDLHNWIIVDNNCAKSRIHYEDKFVFPAYSTDELLAILTKDCVLKVIQQMPLYAKHYKEFSVYSVSLIFFEFIRNTENIGKMCLWLLENGYEWDEKKKMIRRYKC